MSDADAGARAVVVPDAELLAELGDAPAGFAHVLWDAVESGEVAPEEVGFAVVDRRGGSRRRELLAGLPNVAVVQAMSVGVDYLEGRYPLGARVCNASPAISEQTAEHAMALVLALLRRIPDYTRAQDLGTWADLNDPRSPVTRAALGTLWGARAAVIGFGTVGASIARRLRAFGAAVTGYARTGRDADGFTVRPLAELTATIGSADVVLAALPLTPDTEGLFDATFFRNLAPGAVFVNVGRGRSVVQSALVDAVESGGIRAGLDVADPEPLPDGHRLLLTPDVLVTPHVAGDNGRIVETLNAFVAAQARAWQSGRPLEAVIAGPAPALDTPAVDAKDEVTA